MLMNHILQILLRAELLTKLHSSYINNLMTCKIIIVNYGSSAIEDEAM